MPPSTAQRALINQFMSITGIPEKNAQRLLRTSNWKIEPAIESHYASNPSSVAAPSSREKDNLVKLFDKYHDPKTDEPDKVGVEGTMRYLTDLGVNLESADILVPLEIVQAPALGVISRKGFVEGWKSIGADSIDKQKRHVAGQIRQLSTDTTLFKSVYRHTFICSKDESQKALPLDNATVYWQLLFSPPGRPWVTASIDWLKLWTEFLQAKWTKSVNKDMWNQTFEFYLKTLADESLSFWSEDSAWPGVIDEFVAYAKENGDLPESMDTMETD